MTLLKSPAMLQKLQGCYVALLDQRIDTTAVDIRVSGSIAAF